MAGFSIIYADGSEDCRSSGWKETDDLSEIRRGSFLMNCRILPMGNYISVIYGMI